MTPVRPCYTSEEQMIRAGATSHPIEATGKPVTSPLKHGVNYVFSKGMSSARDSACLHGGTEPLYTFAVMGYPSVQTNP